MTERARQIPVELQLPFGAPITCTEGIKGREEQGKFG